MASGRKTRNSRPMWPEYRFKLNQYSFREVLGVEGKTIFAADGSITRYRTFQDLLSFMDGNSTILFVQDVAEWEHTYDFAHYAGSEVFCSERGTPFLIRAGHGPGSNRTYTWISSAKNWDSFLDCGFLDHIDGYYEYMGVGSTPTNGSLGTRTMRLTHGGKRHTALPLACENFIRENRVGGIVQTPGLGLEYDELLKMDMSSAYLSLYNVHPTGTPIFFMGGMASHTFKAYFAQCTVTVPYDLPLGPFPKRSRAKVNWPVLQGVYNDVYLWDFQVQDCIKAGCTVRVHKGWGWDWLTTDNLPWTTEMYGRRLQAQTDFDEAKVKGATVGAIGHHGMSRERYNLVGEENYKGGGYSLVDQCGNPRDLFVVGARDDNSAIMVHWADYTSSMVNSAVYNFALHYAMAGRLVAIDYDAILITMGDELHTYVKRQSIDAFKQPPGTWLWEILHNVHIVQHRSYTAIEHSKLPGVHKQEDELFLKLLTI